MHEQSSGNGRKFFSPKYIEMQHWKKNLSALPMIASSFHDVYVARLDPGYTESDRTISPSILKQDYLQSGLTGRHT